MSFRSFCFVPACLVMASAFAPSARSAAPNLINYQGRLTTSAGTPVADGSYSVNFTLYNAPSGGVPQWGETQSVTTSNGLFTVRLGAVVLFSADLFNDTSLYLAIKVGADPEISPRTRLTAVPYALSSGDGWSHEGTTVHLTTNTDAVGIGTSTPSRPLHVSDPSNGLFVSRIESGNTGATVTEISNISSSSVWESSVAGSAGIPFWGVQPGDMYFYKQGTAWPNAVLTSGGSLGLGTSLPRARIEAVTMDTTAGLFMAGGDFDATKIVHAQYTGTGAYDAIAVFGKSTPRDYYGFGGVFQGGYTGARGIVQQDGTHSYYGLQGLASGAGTGTKTGVYGIASGSGGTKYGVYGSASATPSLPDSVIGVYGRVTGDNPWTYAVAGDAAGPFTHGARFSAGGGYYTVGVTGSAIGDYSTGVSARAEGTEATALGVYATGTNSKAAGFSGNVTVLGTLSKTAGSFKIDHPLDPENKYLQHSFVESPDMMNIYNGNVVTDANGNATISLPNWFEALNKDFRYQLTVIGQFAQAMVSSKVSGNLFSIRTDKPNIEVSWQVTGIRKDAFAERNRIQVEVDKNERERGKFVAPDAYGKGREFGIGYPKDLEKRAAASDPAIDDEKLKIIEK